MNTADRAYEVLAIHKVPALLHDKKCITVVVAPRVSGTAEPVSKGGDKAMVEMGAGTIWKVIVGEI